MKPIVFFSLLLLSSCNKESESLHNEFSGTTWVIWQYKEMTVANPDALNDTLVFLSNNKYTYNGVEQTYSLMYNGTYSQPRLTLYGTLFGNVTGILPAEFNTYGEIVANTFSTIGQGSAQNEYLFWMKKV